MAEEEEGEPSRELICIVVARSTIEPSTLLSGIGHWALGEGNRRACAHRPYAALMTWQFHGLHKKNDLWLGFDTESRLMKCVTRFVLNT